MGQCFKYPRYSHVVYKHHTKSLLIDEVQDEALGLRYTNLRRILVTQRRI